MREEVQGLPEFLGDKGQRELPWLCPPKGRGLPDDQRPISGKELRLHRLGSKTWVLSEDVTYWVTSGPSLGYYFLYILPDKGVLFN